MAGTGPIDRQRDGAGSAALDPALGAIVAMVPMEREGRLYLIAEHGVASGVVADRIDPDRANPAIPWFVQRTELRHGAGTPFVQRTVCAAAALLDPVYLPERIDRERAFALALGAARHLEAAAEAHEHLTAMAAQVAARARREGLDRARLPSTPGLAARAQQAIADLRHVQLAVVELIAMFHPKPTPGAAWDAAFVAAIRAAWPVDDPFVAAIDDVLLPLRVIADHRNAMIHPDAGKRLVIHDYDLLASGEIVAPSIAIDHPRHPLARTDLVGYLATFGEALADRFETLLVVLTDRNARPIGGGRFVGNVAALADGETLRGARYRWGARVAEPE